MPPLIRIFFLPTMALWRKLFICSFSVPNLKRFSTVRGTFENLRMVIQGPFSARGGIMALTLEPSLSLASTSGELSSMRLPMGVTIL